MSDVAQSGATDHADSLVGVLDCGCMTAWLSLTHASKAEVTEFYVEMATSGREVRRVRLHDVRNQVGRCEHGGFGEGLR